jgi:predicted RNase H-like nuclease (RuvC/YqgF family)
MTDVRAKLLKAFDNLKKEGKKISPFAVEKRAGVGNGSCKNHPAILEMVMAEKGRYHPNPEVAKKANIAVRKKLSDKKKSDTLENSKKRLNAENKQLKQEMAVMATSVAQLTWELHRHKTATRKQLSNVRPFTK